MSTKIEGYRLYRDSMGPCGWESIVYLHEETAKLVAEDKKQEWTRFKPHKVTVRMLNSTEGAVGKELVTIDQQSPDDIYRARALKKLTPNERKALGV